MSPYFVYILRCSDGSLYIGKTNDVDARVSRHNDGRGSSFTASRRPVHVVFTETYDSRDEALARERQLKRWTRAKKEALIAGDLLRIVARWQACESCCLDRIQGRGSW